MRRPIFPSLFYWSQWTVGVRYETFAHPLIAVFSADLFDHGGVGMRGSHSQSLRQSGGHRMYQDIMKQLKVVIVVCVVALIGVVVLATMKGA